MLIDTHNHITWGVDDGIKTEEEAMASLRQAQRDGIKAIVATPHFYPNESDDVVLLEKIQKLRRLAQHYQITIYEGCELMLREGYVQALQNKDVITMGHTQYVLVEFDHSCPLPSVEESVDMLHELICRDYIPLIAHVERYFGKKVDYDYLQSWKEMGCAFQVNRSSIVGIHGKAIQAQAMELIRRGMVHMVASDTHSIQRRMCKLSDSFELIAKEFGEEVAHALHVENPKRMLLNERLEFVLPKKQSFFKKLLYK
ncbi:MAG: tyrosine-protein phosphatase [Erysipelotrichaceae bacterium]